MGSAGDKPRKPRHHEPKVPKYEEPNDLPLPGLGGTSRTEPARFGHSSDHHQPAPPGKAGSFLLRLLGKRPKE
jgi:hypothetical protein